MVARSIVSFEPNPEKPWAASAQLSDGTSFYGPTEHIAQAYEQQKRNEQLSALASNVGTGGAPAYATSIGGGAPSISTPATQPAPTMISDVSPNMSSAGPAQSQVPDTGAYNARDFSQGAARLGVTPGDTQAYRSYQEMGGTADLPTFLAGKKTQVSPGRAAVNPEAEARQFLWRTGKATTVEGAKPVDESRWKDVQDKTRAAVDAQAQAQIAEGNAATDTAHAQSLAAQQLHQQMADQQARDEAAFEAKHTAMLQDIDRVNREQVDPQRWFKQHGAIGSMLAIIGSSMLQAANLRNGQAAGPSQMDRFISQDIASQENELARRGASANNKLAELSRQWGSIEAGKAALRASQLRLVDGQLADIAANGRSKVLQQQAAAMRAVNEQKIAQADYDLHAAAQGVRSEREQGQYTSPQKAVAGGARTTYNFGEINKGARENQELDIKGRAKDKEGQDSVAGRTERLGERLSQFQGALDDAQKYYQSVGLVRDKNGKWVDSGQDHPLYGPIDTVRNAIPFAATHSDAANIADANLDIAAEAWGRAQSGAAISDQERAAFRKQLAGTGQANAAAAANAFEQAVAARMNALKAGAGPEASSAYDKGRKVENIVSSAERRRESAITPYRPGGK